MPETLYQIIALDLPAALTATTAAMTCALLGSFLLLRRMSLMGDAISHSVLPGIVCAFLLVGSRATLPVFLGAAAAGILCTVLIEATRRLGRIESGAAMGVVFSTFFAVGVILIEQAAARNVDLDAECLLHGQLEHIFWSPPREWSTFVTWDTLFSLPSELVTGGVVLVASSLLVGLFFKELTLSTFDPALAAALGFAPHLLQTGLMVLVACAVVASFEAVGSILVIAMLVCPAATARLLTDRLPHQLLFSMGIAAAATLSGYFLGAFAGEIFPLPGSVNAAGMIAVMSGVFLGGAALLAPRHGILGRALRRWTLGMRVAGEDLVADLYRSGESPIPSPAVRARGSAFGVRLQTFLARAQLRRAGLITETTAGLALTQAGEQLGRQLVRTHRLWESYLVDELGVPASGVHPQAELLEHVTSSDIHTELAQRGVGRDPHGREIPKG